MSDDLDILERLIGFETLNSASNLHMIDFCQDLLTTCGFRVKRLRDPIEAKAGLFAEIGPAGPGGILLSAHSDVVPVAGQAWTRPPFRLTRDGAWLYGRGTTDMKGFLAQMLALAQKARGAQLSAPLKLLISYDEEIGCVGLARMRARLADLIGQPRLAIVGEPTEMQVGLAHKGKRAYLARVPGQAGHSAAAPNIVSALQVGVDFVTALRALQEDLRQTGARDPAFDVPYTTIHVGTFHSGSALNIVPERAELRFEFRHLAADDPDALEGRIRQAAH
ncbi:MAG: M20/M25/M40 family metallo-hydrolase, partial [Pseudomonadota bacterium]